MQQIVAYYTAPEDKANATRILNRRNEVIGEKAKITSKVVASVEEAKALPNLKLVELHETDLYTKDGRVTPASVLEKLHECW